MVRIETERLVLRDWSLDDLDALCVMTADPEVMKYITRGESRTREQTKEGIERQMSTAAERGFCMWAVEEKATDRLVGMNGIQPLGKTEDVEIGWWLAKDLWGRGLSTEAARAAMDHAFREVGLSRLVAIADPDNAPSIAIMRKLGMTFERMVPLGEIHDRHPEWADWELVFYVRDNTGD